MGQPLRTRMLDDVENVTLFNETLFTNVLSLQGGM